MIRNLIIFLLIARSSLDVFTNISIFSLRFNIPSLVALGLLFFGLLYFFYKGEFYIHKSMRVFGVWILILIFFVVVSIVNFGIQGMTISIREWIRLFTLFFTFVLSYNLITKIEDKKFIYYLFFSLTVPLIVGIYQLLTNSGIEDISLGITRIYGSFAHPNSFGLYLVFFILLTLWAYIESKSKLWFMLIIVEVVCLIFTFSFSSYVLMLMSFFLIVFLKRGKRRVKLFLLFLLVFSGLILINRPEFKKRWERIKLINIEKTLQEKVVVDSFTWRIVNWTNLLEIWKDRPILGTGLQTIELVNPWKTIEGIGYAAHNDFLKILIETGIVGLIFNFFFVAFLGYTIYKEYKKSKNASLKNLLYILFVYFISWQIVSMVDNYITSTAFQLYFWSILGMTFKLNNCGIKHS